MTMRYEFPKITTIDPILELIKDRKEYVHAEREYYDIINYVVMTEESFPAITSENEVEAATLRECRGIAFDKKGNILSRPLHKFFNLNEREETQARNVDFSNTHAILEKYDGSMIRPIFIEQHNGFRLGTKMGITDVAMNAEVFVAENPQYFRFFRHCLEYGLSPIFEWVSKVNRIVINYDKNDLILIAIRELETGRYLDLEEIEQLGAQYGITVVKSYGTVDEINSFIDRTRLIRDLEGFVVRFSDGHMLKIKTDEYLVKHKSRDIVASTKNLIECILNEQVDDLKPMLIPEDLTRVHELEREVMKTIMDMSGHLEKAYELYGNMDRKEYAMGVSRTLTPFVRKGVFSMMDGKDAVSLTKDFLKSNIGTESKLGNLRAQYGIFKEV